MDSLFGPIHERKENYPLTRQITYGHFIDDKKVKLDKFKQDDFKILHDADNGIMK